MVLSLLSWNSNTTSSSTSPTSHSPPPQQPGHHTESPGTTLVNLLDYYATPGAIPPFSRVDPLIKQRESAPLFTLGNVFKLGLFFAQKSTELASEFLSHHVFGPRKPSWGIEMTIISCFMRNIQRHSGLANIVTLRALMQLGGMVPLPSDALVTPVSFKVPRRNLKGLLADFDAAENGERELTAEWVVGKKLWMRLQNEWRANGGGSPHDKQALRKSRERVTLYIHGGAYYIFSAATHRLVTIPLSKYTNTRVFALNYRLAPETKFPGPLHDCVSAYFRLIEELGIPPQNIVLAGDSAGGGLCLALLMYLRDNDYPLPGGAIVMSPWVDLTLSCDSWDSNAEFDVCPRPEPGDPLNPISCYLGDEGVTKYLTHPYASPLFGDFKGLPPLLIQSGDAEVLRDEITLLAHKASLHGVNITHELFEDAVHVFQMFPFLEQTRKSFQSCRVFVNKTLPEHHKGSLPRELDNSRIDSEIGDKEKMRVVDGAGTVQHSPVDLKKEPLDLDYFGKGDDKHGSSTGMGRKRPAEEDDSGDELGWARSRAGSVSRASIVSALGFLPPGLGLDQNDELSPSSSGQDGSTTNPPLSTDSDEESDDSGCMLPPPLHAGAVKETTSNSLLKAGSRAISSSSLAAALGRITRSSEDDYNHRSSAPATGLHSASPSETSRPRRNHARRKTTTEMINHPSNNPPNAFRSSTIAPPSASQTPPSSQHRLHPISFTGKASPYPTALQSPNIKPPSIRSRNRALSHPNVADLCREWQTTGPANSTITYQGFGQNQ